MGSLGLLRQLRVEGRITCQPLTDGHGHLHRIFIIAAVAQQVSKMRILCQQAVKYRTVFFRKVQQDGGTFRRLILRKPPDQCLKGSLIHRRILRTGCNQNGNIRCFLRILRQNFPAKVAYRLLYHGPHGFIVKGGHHIAVAAEIVYAGLQPLHTGTIHVNLRQRHLRKTIQCGKDQRIIPQKAPHIGDLIGLDIVAVRGVIYAEDILDVPLPAEMPHGIVAQPQLSLSDRQVTINELRHLRFGLLGSIPVVGNDILHGQLSILQNWPGHSPVIPGIVIGACGIPAIAAGGGQPWNGVNDIDGFGGRQLLQIIDDVILRHLCAIRQHHVFHFQHTAGVHESAGQKLIQRDQKGIVMLRLIHEPCQQCATVTILGAVGVFLLPVQLGGV